MSRPAHVHLGRLCVMVDCQPRTPISHHVLRQARSPAIHRRSQTEPRAIKHNSKKKSSKRYEIREPQHHGRQTHHPQSHWLHTNFGKEPSLSSGAPLAPPTTNSGETNRRSTDDCLPWYWSLSAAFVRPPAQWECETEADEPPHFAKTHKDASVCLHEPREIVLTRKSLSSSRETQRIIIVRRHPRCLMSNLCRWKVSGDRSVV